MNIFFSTGMKYTKYGGVERMLVYLAKSLTNSGDKLFLQYEEMTGANKFKEDIETAGGKIVIIQTGNKHFISGLFKIMLFIIKNNITLIHANFGMAKDISVLAGRLLGKKKIITHFHTIYTKDQRTGFRFWFLSTFSALNLTVSKAGRENLISMGADPIKTHVLYDGCYIPPTLATKEEICAILHMTVTPIIILCVAWDSDVKGVDLLLKAFSLVSQKYKKARLWIAGASGDSETNKNLSKELGVFENVLWLGIRDDVPNLMNACDIYVQPSRSEAFGLTVAEAMAANKAVVAFKVGGIGEVMLDDETGILVEPESISGLADAITLLIDNSELRNNFGKSGRKRVVRLFDLKREVKDILYWYNII
ncbi:group 1 family glycosyl transferase [Candidatus Omnitrophus magneticus]|uniref:Group 1 family glycosyl transferase n=1 Tax=Candidatus Omnitrophus magneticus TaxID=1609969 RepID=A0A0F0CS93_9BACT|nr:group 1 family glycosyl transferase [Candidatus Omnitrophus magneticus]